MILVLPLVVVRQRKAFRRKNGVTIYFEGNSITLSSSKFYLMHTLDNAGVIVNNKGEMKGVLTNIYKVMAF